MRLSQFRGVFAAVVERAASVGLLDGEQTDVSAWETDDEDEQTVVADVGAGIDGSVLGRRLEQAEGPERAGQTDLH